jgi:hypothetical protein
LKLALPVALLLLTLRPGPLVCQAEWMLDVSVGHTTYRSINARVAASSAIAGVRRDADGIEWAYLYGGVPLQIEGVGWVAGGAGRRFGRNFGRVTAGADVGAHLLGYRVRGAEAGGAATLELLPVAAIRHGPVDVELRSGLLQHTDFYAAARLTRRIHESGVRAGMRLHPGLAAEADARYARAPEGDYPYLGGSVEVGIGAATAWLSAGRWLNDTIATPEFGATIGGWVGERWHVRAGWQQETTSPLYMNPPHRGWTVQVSRRLGSLPAQPAPVVRDAEGRITIRLPISESPSAPSVLGDFTAWRPVPMTRDGEFWTVRLPVSAGVYRYGFQDAGGQWFVPASVTHRVDDGMGGESAVLIVL